MDSPFDVLRVDSDADEDEIERAYRRRVKETHPDQGGSAEAFQRVKEAYDEIRDGDGNAIAPDDVTTPGAGHERRGESDSDGNSETDRETDVTSRVEYLDYEVLADRGWSLDDDDLFEKAAEADLDPEDHGRIVVEPDEYLLEAAENRGFAWPFACRGGACANCAVAVVEGEMTLPVDHVLPEEMTEQGIRLSCMGTPITDETKVVYNVKHIPALDELRLPPHPFEHAHAGD